MSGEIKIQGTNGGNLISIYTLPSQMIMAGATKIVEKLSLLIKC
jgi:hypothetical protein